MSQPNPIHVLGFAGSLRQNSYNKALLRAAEQLVPNDMAFENYDLAAIPLFNADVEAVGTPDSVLHFRDRIRAADALLIATPEYNYSVTAVLKNAIDWASRGKPDSSPLNDKPVAIMGAGGGGGTVRAQMHLREILMHNRNYVVISPQVMVARAGQYFDDNLNLTDAAIGERIHRLLVSLADLTRRLQN
jgi:chromate reductase